jgi:Kef-type K+ transport system membrane component KefB
VVAQVVAPDLRSLALVLLASSLGALLSRLSRRVVLPTVVCEIVLGILIGPEVLGIAEVDPYLQYLSTLGLGLLFFFVGLEVVDS